MNNPIIHINNINAPELDIYARLSEPQLVHLYEPELGLFITESPNVISRALDDGYEPVSLLTEERFLNINYRTSDNNDSDITSDSDSSSASVSSFSQEVQAVLNRCPNVPIYTASIDVLTKITGFQLTRGLLCAMKRRPAKSASELCKEARRIAVLEGIVNPTNIGAIFRSAAALNVDAILLTPDCADPLYRRAARVSMGTVFQVPWTYIGSSREDWDKNGMNTIAAMGYASVAMALLPDSLSIDDPVFKTYDKLAILLGSEGDGLSADTISKCTHTAIIPMSHNVDSLNVAAASAVAFWELCHS